MIQVPSNFRINPSHHMAGALQLAALNGRDGFKDYSVYRCPVIRSGLTPAVQVFPPRSSTLGGEGLNFNTGAAAEINFARLGGSLNKFTNINQAITILAVVYPSDANASAILNLGMRTDTNDSLCFQVDGNGKFSDDHTESSISRTTGTWYYCGVSQASATSRNYFANGTVASNATNIGSSAVGAGQPFTIGAQYINSVEQSASRWIGYIESVFIWNRALSVGQMQDWYRNPYGLFVRSSKSIFIPASAAAPAGSGTVSGTGDATGAGAHISTGSGSVAGVGTAAGVGKELPAGSGAATAAATAAGTGKEVASGSGVVSATGTATGVGLEHATGSGTATGTGAGSGVGSVTTAGSGIVSGTGSATGAGKQVAAGSGLVVGSGALAGAGKKICTGSGTATGTGSATGDGLAPTGLSRGSGIVAGVGTLAGAGFMVATGWGSVVGVGTASGTGRASTSNLLLARRRSMLMT